MFIILNVYGLIANQLYVCNFFCIIFAFICTKAVLD